jgi:hypothetical protein
MEKKTKTDTTRERVILPLAPGSTLRLQVASLKLTDAKEIALAKIIAEETEAERERRRGSLSNTLIPAYLFDEIRQEITRKPFIAASLGLATLNVNKSFRQIVDTLHWDELVEKDDVLKRCAQKSALPLPEVAKFVCQKCEPRNLRAMLQLWRALRVMELAVDFVKDHRAVATELTQLKQEQSKVRELERKKYSAEIEAAIVATERTNFSSKGVNNRHATSREAKRWVQEEWEKHRGSYKENKSDFARTYVSLVCKKCKKNNGDPFTVTEKQMREVWLRNTPSASTQAAQPASG